MSGGLTPGDPLGGDEPRLEPDPRAPTPPPPRGAPEAPAPSAAYGGGPVPPGAFAPRERGGLADPFAGAPPAAWWRRAVAAILDAVLVAVVAGVVLAVLGAVAFGALSLDTPGGAAGALVIALVAVAAVTVGALIYAPLVMARTNGRTVGKMAMGCRVVRGDGRPVDFLWAAYREVLVKSLALGVVGSLTAGVGYLVDYLWPFVDSRNRALHDIVVDSRVVSD
ncbi:MAG TPA: RDD family protein [Solirubrobacteraceae bacterium]|jgi:uncharacterized RDD family membrane protein YckC|nr:RDD family protein [Solirubrobacteraceae bacterium]